MALGPTLIATLGSVLTTWILQGSKAKPAGPPPPPDTTSALPGVSILRHDGARLQLTYRGRLTAKEGRKLIDTFMAGAVEES